jgi:hypothetical protein
LLATRLEVKSTTGTVNFDLKVKLEERERKSQLIVVGFGLLLSTKPSIVRFEIEGVATLAGKDEDIRRMLEVDPETKVPHLLPRVYQYAFTAMYLMSTVLNTPPPPQDLLGSHQPEVAVQGVGEELHAERTETSETSAGKTEAGKEEKSEATAPAK